MLNTRLNRCKNCADAEFQIIFGSTVPFFLLLLALVLHHHFRLTRSFDMDSDIVSQHYIPMLKVFVGKIVEFRRALIERVIEG